MSKRRENSQIIEGFKAESKKQHIFVSSYGGRLESKEPFTSIGGDSCFSDYLRTVDGWNPVAVEKKNQLFKSSNKLAKPLSSTACVVCCPSRGSTKKYKKNKNHGVLNGLNSWGMISKWYFFDPKSVFFVFLKVIKAPKRALSWDLWLVARPGWVDGSKEISWKRCHKDARMFKLNIQHDASEKVTVFFFYVESKSGVYTFAQPMLSYVFKGNPQIDRNCRKNVQTIVLTTLMMHDSIGCSPANQHDIGKATIWRCIWYFL